MVSPSISPLSDSGRVASAPVAVPPPRNFKPLRGQVTDVRMGAEQIVLGRISTDMSLAKIAGLKYEQQFLDHLRAFEPRVYVRPHIHFRDEGAYRTVIPDAVLFCDDFDGKPQIKVFEIKSQHMPEAWWQLDQLYRPVLRTCFPYLVVKCVEVVKTYDPQMPWPGTYVFYNDLEDAIKGVVDMGVLRWRKRT